MCRGRPPRVRSVRIQERGRVRSARSRDRSVRSRGRSNPRVDHGPRPLSPRRVPVHVRRTRSPRPFSPVPRYRPPRHDRYRRLSTHHFTSRHLNTRHLTSGPRATNLLHIRPHTLPRPRLPLFHTRRRSPSGKKWSPARSTPRAPTRRPTSSSCGVLIAEPARSRPKDASLRTRTFRSRAGSKNVSPRSNPSPKPRGDVLSL